MAKKQSEKKPEIELPKGIKESDLSYPKNYKNRVVEYLELYYTTAFGWCIATLHIRNAGRRSTNKDPRTYAVKVDDGSCVRVGLGPHVLKRVTVYVTEKRLKDLQRFIDLKNSGEITANEIRDRISTRRAQGSIRRSKLGWDW